MDQLRLQLQRLRQFSCSDGLTWTLSFVPETDLRMLLTGECLENALQNPCFCLEPHHRPVIVNEVLEGAIKIFAILVELRMESRLQMCLELCLTDFTLPILDAERLNKIFPESASHFQKLQYEYVPLKLREFSHKYLEANLVLPYIKNIGIASGAYSKVFKVKIHPFYQDWERSPKSAGIELVRKEITSSSTDEAQRRESDLLFLLGSLKNNNIVRLVASYTQNGNCSLLFPVADLDLHDLLLDSEQPGWIKDETQVIFSFRGLVNGLHYLHSFQPLAKSAGDTERITRHGYHHDIKPRNILVKGNRLILADFGLSRLKLEDQDSQTFWKNTPPTYGAPEARDATTLQPRKIGRAYDIWSLGCVLSEFATYSFGGASAVKEFRKEREIEGVHGKHNCFHHEGDISQSVVAWLRKLKDVHSSSSISWLFEFSSQLLKGDPTQRPKAAQIVQEFNYTSLARWIVTITSTLNNSEAQEGLSTVYLAKLILEKNRIQAWAYALGVQQSDGQSQIRADQICKDYDRIYSLLKRGHDDIVELLSQVHEPEVQQRVLSLLEQINESLLLGLPESTKNTIDNTFKLLTISEKRTVQLLVDSEREDSAPTTQDREYRLLAAARHISHMVSMDPKISEGINFIDPLLIVEGAQQPIRPNALSIRWLYAGFRESDRHMVLVEERLYNGRWTNIPNEDEFEDTGKAIFHRIKELAKLFQMQPKPKDMRVLNCLGLCHSPSSTTFGYVYQFPDIEGLNKDQLEPVSLDDIIRETKDPLRQPTLNAKFALSQVIASCLYSLHLSGWVHKSIRSSNIIFFHNKSQDLGEVNLRTPYLVGFQHSRQSGPETYSEGYYTTEERLFIHPQYQKGGSRFHSAFDYYSLGVVLLEVALWRPIHKVIPYEDPTKNARVVLLETADQYVSQRMGTGYRDVIIACLDFFDKCNEGHEQALLLKFQEVLETLQRTSLA